MRRLVRRFAEGGGRPRLTYANVMASVAVFVALGGSAVAVSNIDGGDIRARSTPGNKLARDSVTGKEVSEQSLKGFVRKCARGSVHGFVRIIASAGFPSTFTSDPAFVDPGLRFHCSGGNVLARRVSAGVYHVRFKPNIGALAFGNGEGNNLISTRVVEDATIGDKPVFRAEVRDVTAVGSPPADIPFSLLVP